MEFLNHTPFGAAAYRGLDPQSREHEVIVVRTVYRLVPAWRTDGEAPPSSGPTRFIAEIIDEDAPPLVTVDVYEGEIGFSSVKVESDLAPFKPKCDVLVTGHSHAPGGRPATDWLCRLRVSQPSRHPDADRSDSFVPPLTDPAASFTDRMAWQESKRIAGDAWLRAPGPNGERSRELLLDKAIHVCGGREFVRQRNEWVLRQTSTESRVPLRYELAYGGSCVVVNPVYVDDPASVQLLMNEVCYLNPIGRGWVHEDYLRTLSSIGLPHPLVVPAPQIELESSGMSRPDVTPQSGGLQPPEMALLSQQYSHRPAGFGPIGRAWTPRIQRAGTYDDRWTEDRWPALPEDFDMAYWNAAPEDQQIRFPRPDLYVELGNLVDPALCPSGYAVVVLPGHRASVLFHLASGLMLGGPCVIDTLHVDTDAMEIAITWRASVLVEMNVVTAELRFETDLRCPLFQKKTRPPQAMPQESPHG